MAVTRGGYPEPALIAQRYRVERELGGGGMANVYLCWDERLQLWCAVKVMMGQAVREPVLRARFVQEARTLARLGHPNLVRLFDLVDDVQMPFMVMEYLEGGTVADRLTRGPLHVYQALSVAADMCSALQAAHDAGVVHRDIKPQNVLLDAAGVVKVSDFGVARVEQAERLTMTNTSLGTLAYMPPEQQRDAARVDHRADLYAVGATLYAMVAGRRPTALLTQDRDEALAVLPSEARTIVRMATAPEPSSRYESAVILEATLRRAMSTVFLPPDAVPLVDRRAPPPLEPRHATDVAVDPAILVGTARTYRPHEALTVPGVPALTPSLTPSIAPPAMYEFPPEHTGPASAFHAIDPSRDTPPRRSSGRRTTLLFLGFVLAVTSALCCGAASLGGVGTWWVWPG